MPKYAMAVDLERCQGCRACVEACKVENNTSQGVFWMHVFRLEEGEYPDTQISFLPRPCQHCDNAPCVKVCPVGARYKRIDGLVLTDYERCIGCRYCEVACPYGVNFFNWKQPAENYYMDWSDPDIQAASGGAVPPYRNPDLDGRYGSEQKQVAGGGHFRGIVEKCTFCVQRIEKGLQPACVTVCPVQALVFGDLDDQDSPVSTYLTGKQTFRLLDEVGTEPRVHYVGGRPPGTRVREIEPIGGTVQA